MSVNIDIQLTEESKSVLARLSSLPRDMMTAIAGAMDSENLLTVSHIQRKYLAGSRLSKPSFPGLRFMTGNYSGSLRPSKASISGVAVISSIGTNVTSGGFSYPTLHEFGGRFQKKSGNRKVHKIGSRVVSGAKFFAALKRKPKGGVRRNELSRKNSEVRAHTVDMPAREPIQRGILDRQGDYSKAISGAIAALGSGGAS